MKAFSRITTGAAAAALVALSASPAQAQFRDYDRDRGVDVGDVLTGVAVVAGIAAATGAISNAVRGGGYDYGRYGYPNQGYGYPTQRYGYPSTGYGYGRAGYGEGAAVNSCLAEAQRYGAGGNVQITDVDRRSSNKYRVRGVVDGSYDARRYDRYGSRVSFECDARADGRITDFDTDRRYAGRW